MASSSPKQLSSDQPLNYNTWVLKVSIHCEGCKAKVKKVLHKINGVYTTSIDTQQQRVTVTGNVDVETLINKLMKTGKHAQIWPQTLSQHSTKPKNKASQSLSTNNNNNNISSSKTEAQASASTATTSEAGPPKVRHEGQRSKEREKSPEKSPSGEAEGGDGSSRKKKRKGQKGNSGNESRSSQLHNHDDQLGSSNEGVNHNYYNLNNHTQQQSYWYPYYYYPNQYYGNYSNIGPSRTLPSWPYTCQYQGTPLGSTFEIFSDENVDGCFIM